MKRLSSALIPLLLPLLAAGCDAIRVRPEAQSGKTNLEVAIFEGGYGSHWHQSVAQRFNEEYADRKISATLWGDPRVIEKIKPRLLRGDPPDVLLMHNMPMWRLIAAGKLLPLDDILDRTIDGTNQTWRSTFSPGTLDVYATREHVYAIPSAFAAWGCWYDAKLFRDHGWKPPQTWAEFEKLCESIQAAGIAPIAFQGKYPGYGWITLVTAIQRVAGLAALNRINAMEPGAFSHPDVVRGVTLMQNMAVKYFQKGSTAMTHTESQLQFVNNKAAMIFCGIWLENEMRDSTPKEFEMRCFNLPRVEGGKGNAELFCGFGAEVLFVPTDARYPEAAKEFIRYMVSPINAPSMGKTIGVISPLRGATPREALTPTQQSVLDMIEHAPGIFNDRISTLLLEWNEQVNNPALAKLMEGSITPEEFCRRLDEGIAKAKADPNVVIPEYVPYDPTKFGEQP